LSGSVIYSFVTKAEHLLIFEKQLARVLLSARLVEALRNYEAQNKGEGIRVGGG
jgi:hypothetical protein